jgi:hypothetical protein
MILAKRWTPSRRRDLPEISAAKGTLHSQSERSFYALTNDS